MSDDQPVATPAMAPPATLPEALSVAPPADMPQQDMWSFPDTPFAADPFVGPMPTAITQEPLTAPAQVSALPAVLPESTPAPHSAASAPSFNDWGYELTSLDQFQNVQVPAGPQAASDWADHDIGPAAPVPASPVAVRDDVTASSVDEPAAPESEAVSFPVREPGVIETRPLAPMPPEPQSTVAKRGDTLWKYSGGDVATIGDLALRNGLNSSRIITGRVYDTTPMDRENLTPADIRVREQIGQAYLNQDNARLSALAEVARQQAADRAQQANNPFISSSNFGTEVTGTAAPGSFAALGQPIPSIFTSTPPAADRFSNVLTNDANNATARVAQTPGKVLGEAGVTLFGLNDAASSTRSAGQTGSGTGFSQYGPGEISVLGIDNYSVTALNNRALGGTLGLTLTGTSDNIKGFVTAESKAQSLLTDSMFNVQPNGIGTPGESFRFQVAAKGLMEAGNVKEYQTAGVYADLNKKTVVVNALSGTAGAGVSLEFTNPFDSSRKIGAEASFIGDMTFIESKQMSAAGAVWNPQTGIYGLSAGFETRNRAAAIAETINIGADLGVARGKISGQTFQSFGPVPSGGGTGHVVWNDNTGTLTLQATSSLQFGLGAGFDLSGEVQVDAAKGLFAGIRNLVSPPVSPPPRP